VLIETKLMLQRILKLLENNEEMKMSCCLIQLWPKVKVNLMNECSFYNCAFVSFDLLLVVAFFYFFRKTEIRRFRGDKI